AGRFLRGRVVHQWRDSDRLHRRHQGDRRPADRQARADPRPDRFAAAQAGRPRGVPRGVVPPLGPRPLPDRATWAYATVPCDHRRMEDRTREEPAEPETAYELLQRGTALLDGRHHAQAAIVLERADRLEPGKGSILEAL